MARYTGPKTKIARKFHEPIYGPDKNYEKKPYAPGMHGQNKRRGKTSEYGIQLQESRRQNILTVFWNVSSVNSMLRLHAVAVLPVRNS